MSYTFDIAISASLNKETVENILKDYLERDTGRKVKSISYTLTDVSDPMDRYSHKVFNGCTVQFESDKKTGGPAAHEDFSGGGYR